MLDAGEQQNGMKRLTDVIAQIAPLDTNAMQAAETRQAQLTKPEGSLGRLETLATQIAGMVGEPTPDLRHKVVIVMAGDHGVTVEGVSAYPADVTPQMALNFLHGGAAINALAGSVGARVVVVDVGIAAEVDHPALRARKVSRGTANMAVEPAMTRAQTLDAIAVGFDTLDEERGAGLDVVALGEMGIGNTTAASAITAVITGTPVALVTGRGTGIDELQLAQKISVIERAIARNTPNLNDPLDVLAKVGGLEIAGLVGVVLAAAAERIPVVLDGFITSAAALVAVELCPGARDYLIAGHVSVERGHQVILERLGLTPLLNLGMRLGEGSGATLAMSVIEGALRAHREMATFAEAGVSERSEIEESNVSSTLL